MKTLNKISCVLLGAMFAVSCSDFDELSVNPKAASAEQVQIEYFINNSITQAQMDPDVAERSFVLYWKTASRQHRANGSLALGSYNNDWTTAYYNQVSGWLKTANLAITVAEEKEQTGAAKAYNNNLLQIARIWRAYLMSEFSDNFGPMPIDGFAGKNPTFSSVKDVYYFILSELSDASAKLDVTQATKPESKYDKAYGFDYLKWKKYANSLRLRYAMRLSEVDAAKAKAEFEDAASKDLLIASSDIFKVAERPGWDALTGVMSREWNSQNLSATLNNLYIGLGGINSTSLLPTTMHANIKPANYMGLKFDDHLTSMTNDPSAGYWFDGLHAMIDPRAYKAFSIPGNVNDPDFCKYPSWDNSAITTKRTLVDATGAVVKEIDASYTWNAACLGNWGTKSAKNNVSFFNGTNPRLVLQFRNSTSQRVFFGNWETYFLLAEAALRGWNVSTTAKAAYESGVRASFEYWKIASLADAYLASENYNRVGTSAKFDHTSEPPSSVTMNYVNGYTGITGTVEMKYPVNTLYKNGSVKNDQLTKIITQKYLAQLPWLPLEAWNDQRRLGLPFFENPAVDQPITDLPDLNAGNYMTNNVKFFPQRIKYPSGLANSNPAGYAQAVQLLGGADAVLTPLWWAKK